ncbi:MAG TPA: gliding motility-associated C-terminal domain-containing protein, partial [Flavobacteriales bacterium]|nr:gliding motility-associated C-terminal domain-containing protein [Flavobacteriales bacterium]
QLLFTTNGETVYDRLGDPMPNGVGLAGSYSSSQSALIVPFVGDPDRYYVFTTPAQLTAGGGVYAGLAYSVVDMTLNGGLGDVATLNVLLVDQVTEHLTAIRHANGRDVWVVCHGWNSDLYHTYLVSCDGVSGPVDSHAGDPLTQDPGNGFLSAMGCARISPLGDRIALTWAEFDADFIGTAHLDVLSFDNTTGTVGAGVSIIEGDTDADNLRGYGVAFSPDGSRLYWSEYGLQAGIGFSALVQFDMTVADLPTSAQVIASGPPEFGTLQLGPDGKLYCARLGGASYISRIDQPNALGTACNFQDVAVSIAPAQSTWGLSNDWDTFPVIPPLEPLVLNDTIICSGSSFIADATYTRPFETPTYLWSTGATTPTITIAAAGHYTVEVQLSCDVHITAEFDVSFGGASVELGEDRLLCLGDSLPLEAPNVAGDIFWSTGDTTRITWAHAEGPVWLTILQDDGCIARDTVFVDVTDCTCPVYVPNAFTPNTDDINDGFAPRGNCDFRHYKLSVFDRWGREIFASDDPQQAWNGDGVPLGVYTWALDYAWYDGERERTAERTGHITLIR